MGGPAAARHRRIRRTRDRPGRRAAAPPRCRAVPDRPAAASPRPGSSARTERAAGRAGRTSAATARARPCRWYRPRRWPSSVSRLAGPRPRTAGTAGPGAAGSAGQSGQADRGPGVVDGAGQVEFFAATKAGGLADAWLASGVNGAWAWGSPLAGPGSSGAGIKIGGSPSAATWPSGKVLVYARLRRGQVGDVRHEGTGLVAPAGRAGHRSATACSAARPRGSAPAASRRRAASTPPCGWAPPASPAGWSEWTDFGGSFLAGP